jgi:phosphoserine phosphatase
VVQSSAAKAAWLLTKYNVGLVERRENLEPLLDQAGAPYAGLDQAYVQRLTAAWFDQTIAATLRPGAKAALEGHRQRGAKLVLATSSWQYVAAEATRCFELDDYISSQFDVDPQVR